MQVLQDVAGDALKRITCHKGRRAGARPHRRPQLPAMALGRVYKTTHRNVHAGELRLHRLATDVSRKRVASVERRPIGQAGRKGIGLVLKACDKNLGHTDTPGALAISERV